MATFPVARLRRFRRTAALRSLVRETRLDPGELVYPMFVSEGEGVDEPLAGLPGISRRSVDVLVDEAAGVRNLGIGAVLLFGVPDAKDDLGSGAYDDEGVV
jgi:porphobilinogen synthase